MTGLRPLAPLAAADLDVLTGWWEAIRAVPDAAPSGTSMVQARLIRSVAVGELPALGRVFLKWMHFPRAKDRLRYAFRRLPAVHEARMLGLAAEAGIEAARPVAVGEARAFGLPSRSLLVTSALPGAERAATMPDCVAVAAKLAGAGLFHPDLNPGNFVSASANSGAAVLDFQSARALAAPLSSGLRRRMAAKLWSEGVAAATGQDMAAAADAAFRAAAVGTGLLDSMELEPTWALARRQRVRFERGRWLRCLRNSTQFRADRGWSAITYRRRGSPLDAKGWLPGDRALWLGDRWLELTRVGYRPAADGMATVTASRMAGERGPAHGRGGGDLESGRA